MTTGGWILLVLAWGSILALTAWCMVRVLSPGGDTDSSEAGAPPPVVPTS